MKNKTDSKQIKIIGQIIQQMYISHEPKINNYYASPPPHQNFPTSHSLANPNPRPQLAQPNNQLSTDLYLYNFHSKSLPNQSKPINNNYDVHQREQHRDQGLLNKSFLDKFDNNSSVHLGGQKSYARNIRGRLLNDNDPVAERAKEQKLRQYREELQRQMQTDKERKQTQKRKIEEQQMERERKFYQGFKIEPQRINKGQKQEENPYFMMRTYQKGRKRQQLKQPNKITEILNQNSKQQKIMKASRPAETKENAGWTANQKKKKIPQLSESMVRERQFEEERIAKILLFQRKVLQKLNDIKHEIRATHNFIDTNAELQRVRNSLKGRNNYQNFTDALKNNNQLEKSSVVNNSEFYALPKKSAKPKLPTFKSQHRYHISLNDAKTKNKSIGSDYWSGKKQSQNLKQREDHGSLQLDKPSSAEKNNSLENQNPEEKP